MDKLIELKPCPFCGCEASPNGRITRSHSPDLLWRDGSEAVEAFYCNCVRCGAKNGGIAGGYQTRDEAISHWNTRAAVRAHDAGTVSTAQLDAEDQHPKMRAEPVEDVEERCDALEKDHETLKDLMYTVQSTGQLIGDGQVVACARINGKILTAYRRGFAVAREGYVKLEDALDPPDDIECALADKGERQRWQDAVREAFKVRRAHLAPKPEPTLAEEIDKILLKHNIRTVTSENVVCNSAVSAELASLVERRTK